MSGGGYFIAAGSRAIAAPGEAVPARWRSCAPSVPAPARILTAEGGNSRQRGRKSKLLVLVRAIHRRIVLKRMRERLARPRARERPQIKRLWPPSPIELDRTICSIVSRMTMLMMLRVRSTVRPVSAPRTFFIDRHRKPHSLHRIPALKAMGLKQPTSPPLSASIKPSSQHSLPSKKSLQP